MTRVDFSQMYIPHGYVEIYMPAKETAVRTLCVYASAI